MIRLASFVIPAVSVAILLAGCSQDSVLVQPPSFDRPEDLAFTCFDRVARRLVPLTECNGVTPDSVQAADLGLTALVTQTGRSEVAAVDVTAGAVLDADRTVPGFTFVRVAEAPSGIVVHPERPGLTYIASFGARKLEAVPTHLLHPQAEGPAPAVPEPLPLPAAPTDLALAPTGDALYLPLPTRGSLYRVPLAEDGTFVREEVVEIALPDPSTEPAPVDLTAIETGPPATALASAYGKFCLERSADDEAPVPPVTPPRDETVTGGARPHPVSLRFDPQIPVDGALPADVPVRLYVADEARPVVHVATIAEGTDGITHSLDAINVQVPTRQVAVTPPVPSHGPVPLDDDATAACVPARYLYAIDDTDGTVLAVDVSDEASPSYGAVLPVSTGAGPHDRIDFGTAYARSLEVISPEYGEPDAPCGLGRRCGADSDGTDVPGPFQLRGVFLVAGLSDGTLRFADVHDMDGPCRADDACRPAEDTEDGLFLQRHRPRLSATGTTIVEVAGTPTFAFDGVPNPLLPNGTVESGLAPGLEPLVAPEGEEDACPEGMRQVFGHGEADPTLICAAADPWGGRAQRWRATWNATVPGTQGGRGRFTGEAGFVAAGAQLCDRGVLGSDDVDPEKVTLPEGAPERGYAGDVLVITSPLPDGRELEDPGCERFRVAEDEELPDIAFPIVSARQNADGGTELVLGGDVDARNLVRRCYDELVGYEVRLRGAYGVIGSRTGFLHRVEADEMGRCRVDLDQPPERTGRALPTQLYDNGLVAFTIRAFDEPMGDDDPGQLGLPPGTTGELELDLGQVPAPVVVDLCRPDSSSRCRTALPAAMRFNPADDRLYVVDMSDRGMLTIAPRPLQIVQAFD